MQFGNWQVTEENISWTGEEDHSFVIPVSELNRVIVDREGQMSYDWILKATEEEWLSQDDLYDLNFAFVYAVARFNMDFDYSIFDATLEEQFDRFDDEDDDDEYYG